MLESQNNSESSINTSDIIVDNLNKFRISVQLGLDQKTQKYDYKSLRAVIKWCQNSVSANSYPPSEQKFIDAIEILLQVLSDCSLPLDGLMLSSVALCNSICVTFLPPVKHKIFLSLLEAGKNIFTVTLSENKHIILSITSFDLFKLCVCHGIISCRYFWSNVENDPHEENLVSRIFDDISCILLQLCYQHCNLTLVAFRTLLSYLEKFKEMQSLQLPSHQLKEVFSLAMLSWDHPVPSVTEVNCKIFSSLFDVRVEEPELSVLTLLETIMNSYPWNLRQKYVILDVLLPKYGVYKALKDFPDLVPGLLSSLKYLHIVPASTNTYKTCLKFISSEQWQEIIMPFVIKMLFNDDNNNSVQDKNLFTYWMFPTLKSFPSVLTTIIDFIRENVNISNPTEKNIFIILNLISLEQRLSLDYFSPKWREKTVNDFCLNIQNLVKTALLDSSEVLRSQAFACLCNSSKCSSSPTLEELELISEFIVDNVNADSAVLRESIINSFTLLLKRTINSCLQELKKSVNLVDLQEIYSETDIECCNKTERHIPNFRKFRGTRLYGYVFGLKYNCSENSLCVLSRIEVFLDWLYDFLIFNLEAGTNYQRKVLSLQIYEVVLRCIIGDKNKNQKLSPENGVVFMEYLHRRGKWQFCSSEACNVLLMCVLNEDVKERACFILTEFCQYFLVNNLEVEKIFKVALSLCQSPLFFMMGSGSLLFRLIATSLQYSKRDENLKILLSHIHEYSAMSLASDVHAGEYTSLTSILFFLAEKQWDVLQRDLLKGSSSGSPLYGLLMALSTVALGRNSPESHILKKQDVNKILELVECVTHHMLNILSSKSSKLAEFAPSFAEMGEAIQCTVQEALSGDNETYLSPAYQLVLSCIWLNLKICCFMAAELSSTCVVDFNMVERCASLITRVLTKCRHKGAIEAAGVALSNFVSSATKNHDDKIRCIPKDIIIDFLSSLCELSSGTSVTRRSAGYGILVHNIVSSDKQNGKPILHLCIPLLLEVAKKKIESVSDAFDMPQAEALHFLRKLVHDASLRHDMAQYLSDIALLCFEKLSCDVWSLRNAALQLFGALLPRLVGEKKCHSDDGYNDSSVTVEEFCTRFPELATFLLRDLEDICLSTHLLVHSRAVPALTLLSRLVCTEEVLTPKDAQEKILRFRKCFLTLSSTQSFTVRNLSAKSFSAFSFTSEIVGHVKTLSSKLFNSELPENEVNGILLILKHLTQKSKTGSFTLVKPSHLHEDVQKLINSVHSTLTDDLQDSVCFNKTVLSSLSVNNCSKAKKFAEIESLPNTLLCPKICPGRAWFIKNEVNYFIMSCSEEELEKMFDYLFEMSNDNSRLFITQCFLEGYKHMMDHFSSDLKATLFFRVCFKTLDSDQLLENCAYQLHELLLSLIADKDLVFNFFVKVHNLKNIPFVCEFNSKEFFKLVGRKECAILPVLCGSIAILSYNHESVSEENFNVIHKVLRLIQERCNSSLYNEDYRKSAAISLNILAPCMKRFSSIGVKCFLESASDACSIAEVLLDSVLILLQDEEIEVRSEATKFLTLCDTEPILVPRLRFFNPHFCIRKLFQPDVLKNYFTSEEIVKYMWSKFQYTKEKDFLEDETYKTEDIINPFDCGTSNVYMEKVKILDIILSSILHILETSASGDTALLSIPETWSATLEADLSKFWKFLSMHIDYAGHKFWIPQFSTSVALMMKKCICQYHVMRSVYILNQAQQTRLFGIINKCLIVLKVNYFIYIESFQELDI